LERNYKDDTATVSSAAADGIRRHGGHKLLWEGYAFGARVAKHWSRYPWKFTRSC